jgi:hypothetical protein
MLERICHISQGIKGLDPNKDEQPQLDLWLEKHPVFVYRPQEAQKRVMENFKKMRLEDKQELDSYCRNLIFLLTVVGQYAPNSPSPIPEYGLIFIGS